MAKESNHLMTVLKWILYLPLLYAFMALLRIGLTMADLWMGEQIKEDGLWSHVISEWFLYGIFWMPYALQVAIILWITNLCSKPQIGGAIALTLMVLSLVNFYFIEHNRFHLLPGIADIVMIGTLVYVTFIDKE